MLGLVGATDRYIRLPFLLEGAMEAALAMGLALLSMELLLSRAEIALGEIMPVIGLHGLAGLGANLVLMLLGGAATAGWLGSHLSMKGA